MIRAKRTDGASVMAFYCDHCQRKITDLTMGIAIWSDSESEESGKLYFVHKGACDPAKYFRCSGPSLEISRFVELLASQAEEELPEPAS
jgi:hypothetical protein